MELSSRFIVSSFISENIYFSVCRVIVFIHVSCELHGGIYCLVSTLLELYKYNLPLIRLLKVHKPFQDESLH